MEFISQFSVTAKKNETNEPLVGREESEANHLCSMDIYDRYTGFEKLFLWTLDQSLLNTLHGPQLA